MVRASFTFAELVAPAAALAHQGLIVGGRCRRLAADRRAGASLHASSARIYLKPDRRRPADRRPHRARRSRRHPGHDRRLGRGGFYKGPVAQKIVAAVQEAGGRMTMDDLANYHAVEREPVSGTYRGHQIVSMPPPSSGGAHVIEILNILEGFPIKRARAQLGRVAARNGGGGKARLCRSRRLARRSGFHHRAARRPRLEGLCGHAARDHLADPARVLRRTSVPASRSDTRATRRRISRSSTPTATRSPTPIR